MVFFWSHLQVFIGEVSAVDAGSERRVKCLGWSHWQIPGHFSILFGDSKISKYRWVRYLVDSVARSKAS